MRSRKENAMRTKTTRESGFGLVEIAVVIVVVGVLALGMRLVYVQQKNVNHSADDTNFPEMPPTPNFTPRPPMPHP